MLLSCCCVASVVSDSVRPQRWKPTRLPCPWDSPGKNTGVGCHFLLQCMKVKTLSRVQLFVTPWTVAYQAPPPMGFSRQEYWSGLPLPSRVTLLQSLIIYWTIHLINCFKTSLAIYWYIINHPQTWHGCWCLLDKMKMVSRGQSQTWSCSKSLLKEGGHHSAGGGHPSPISPGHLGSPWGSAEWTVSMLGGWQGHHHPWWSLLSLSASIPHQTSLIKSRTWGSTQFAKCWQFS